MNFKIKLISLLGISLSFGGFLLTSCVDDESEVGLNLHNPEDRGLVYNDSTIKINTYTYQKADSIYLNPLNLLLGYNIDEKLGEFQNNFMTEVGLSSLNPSFGNNPIADSLTLFLDYTYAYGDTTQTQTISVYELKKGLSLNDPSNSIHGKFMSEANISEYYEPTLITTFEFTPNPADTAPIEVLMPKDFSDRFLNESFYATQDTFQTSIFRGFYFVAEPTSTGGSINYFNIGDDTRMDLNYHNDTGDSTYIYYINSSTYRCNIFSRTPSIDALPINSESDPSREYDLFYIKFNSAFEGKIEISGLQSWADTLGVFTLNKAMLDIYTEESETSTDELYYPLPPIEVLILNDQQERVYLSEYLDEQIYHDTLPDGYGYHININQTLNYAIQNGDDKINLILTTDKETNKSFANRMILKGALNKEHPLKLRLTYTKLNIE